MEDRRNGTDCATEQTVERNGTDRFTPFLGKRCRRAIVSCPAAPPTRGRNVWSILKRSLVLRRHIRYSWNVICARANNNRYNYSARDRSYSKCEIMTDFQACADDHVDTSSSVTSACYICRSCLSSPKGRRMLDSVSE